MGGWCPIFCQTAGQQAVLFAAAAAAAVIATRLFLATFVDFIEEEAHEHTLVQTRIYPRFYPRFYVLWTREPSCSSRLSATASFMLLFFFALLFSHVRLPRRFLAAVIPGGAYLIPVSLRTDPATQDPSLYALRNDGTASPAAVGTLGIKNALPPEMHQKTTTRGGGGRGGSSGSHQGVVGNKNSAVADKTPVACGQCVKPFKWTLKGATCTEEVSRIGCLMYVYCALQDFF